MFSFGVQDRRVFLLAGARTAVCAWRAAHQSITIDEATTFRFYVKAPWSSLYAHFLPNNHVLYSLLARLSVALFGTSEAALRLPSVIAGFFFIAGVFAALEIAVSRPFLRWIAIAAVSLQPLLLDFSVAARGYGLGLTLLVWAVFFCMRRRYAITAVMLALAVAAQLSMAIPALALIAGAALFARHLRPTAEALLVAGAAVVLACVIPLQTVAARDFNVGYPTLRESLYSLVFPSTTDRQGLFVNAHTPAVAVEMIVVVLIGCAIAFETLRQLARKPGTRLLAPIALLISAAALVAARHLAHFNYPADRTGIFLILLFALAWPIAADRMESRRYRLLHAALGCLFIIQFAAQFELRYFRLWKFDMDTRRVALLLRDECAGKPAGSVRASVVWISRHSLDYYRQTLPIPALRPIEHVDPPPLRGYDFYVLNPAGTEPRPDPEHFRIIFSGAESGIILAAPR